MKRLTDKRFIGLNGTFYAVSPKERKEIAHMKKPSVKEIYERLGELENQIEDGKIVIINKENNND